MVRDLDFFAALPDAAQHLARALLQLTDADCPHPGPPVTTNVDTIIVGRTVMVNTLQDAGDTDDPRLRSGSDRATLPTLSRHFWQSNARDRECAPRSIRIRWSRLGACGRSAGWHETCDREALDEPRVQCDLVDRPPRQAPAGRHARRLGATRSALGPAPPR